MSQHPEGPCDHGTGELADNIGLHAKAATPNRPDRNPEFAWMVIVSHPTAGCISYRSNMDYRVAGPLLRQLLADLEAGPRGGTLLSPGGSA